MTPEWIWMAFLFAFGACLGSFLNVVIYRLPLGKSIVTPPSACPACGQLIPFYDNIPLLSWLILGAKCRRCKAPISPRYFIVELLTAILVLGLYLWLFVFQYRQICIDSDTPMNRFFNGGYIAYFNFITLIAVMLAASAIDLQLWIIPIGLCWFATAVAIVVSAIAPFFISPDIIERCRLFPQASPNQAALALGASVGLILALAALKFGIIKASYPMPDDPDAPEPAFNDRIEVLKETLFLIPIVAFALAAYLLLKIQPIAQFWENFAQLPAIKGFTGALAGYFIGCAVVWATRILGTLAFGREAMGLGDVHLMGAAGAVIGPAYIVLSFFIAPFFGLAWALYQWIFKKRRQIPYGPFLSFAVFAVIIFHDWIRNLLQNLYGIY